MGMGVEKDNRSWEELKETHYDIFALMKLFIAIYSRNPAFEGLCYEETEKGPRKKNA
jgi:hypothetical protein